MASPGGVKRQEPAGEVAKLFKDFAVGEKQQLLQRKQALQKREKDGIIHEFKTFSAQFKVGLFLAAAVLKQVVILHRAFVQLKMPMPSDLQEILNKDKMMEKKEKDKDMTSAKGYSPPGSVTGI